MIRISIIVPVYNVDQYLKQCVDSLIDQSYPHIEIVLIDDGSTDRSGIICDEIAKTDKRIKVIHKDNGGLSDARNVGIKHATGQYISFVDSDDWIHRDMIREMVEACETEHAEIAVCGYEKVYATKTIKVPTHYKVLNCDDAIYELLNNIEFQDHVCTKLFKKSVWGDVFFPEKVFYEDIRTTYKVFQKAEKVVLLNGCFYYYRQRRGAIAGGIFDQRKFQNLDAVNELYKQDFVYYNKRLKQCVKDRINRVYGFLTEDILLKTNEQEFPQYESFVIDCCKKYKKLFCYIIFNKDYFKSLKLLAFLSLFGYRMVKYEYRKGIVSKYYKKKYKSFY